MASKKVMAQAAEAEEAHVVYKNPCRLRDGLEFSDSATAKRIPLNEVDFGDIQMPCRLLVHNSSAPHITEQDILIMDFGRLAYHLTTLRGCNESTFGSDNDTPCATFVFKYNSGQLRSTNAFAPSEAEQILHTIVDMMQGVPLWVREMYVSMYVSARALPSI